MPAGAEESFDFRLYRYTPSLWAAIITAIIFAILTAIHTWRMFRSRAFYFTAFTIGGAFQAAGYCGRIWSYFDDMAIGGFVIQAILILVAPALYAASIYMILGRLIRALRAEHLSFIPVKWLTKIFVIGDVVAFTMQAGGGGIQAAGTLELYELGEKIIIVGLFVQIVIFSIFMATSITVHRRISADPTPAAIRGNVPWKKHLWVLYATSLLILVRSAFRVVEYLQGNGGYLISHEIYLYIFDAVLMAAVMLIFVIWYIGDLEQNKSDMYALGTMSRVSLVTDRGAPQGPGDAVKVREMV
ncbi:RTA1 like protein-domain-containing protein [Plectosphaerella plurivora]|uniref:RTA1 like protein-domain-containing protein n=1 Tax=Plectosphaerella plurivora TaxID=936078 RepID=A0A9P9AFL7_9PEZI|nr:RTA1 like protein-domain-containing protein [Plectosphaerella plurivora]